MKYHGMEKFKNRENANISLEEKLSRYINLKDCVVIALPPGGIPLGLQISRHNKISLGTVVTQSMRLSTMPAAVIGSVTVDGSVALEEDMIEDLNILPNGVEANIQDAKWKLQIRKKRYYEGMSEPEIENRTVIKE